MHRSPVWLLLSVLAFGFAPTARADEAKPAEDEQPPAGEGGVAGVDETPLLREAEAAEAKPLIAALKKAFKKKNSNDVKAALEGIQGLKHKGFLKPLIKLLGHENARAALWAGESLQHRATKDDVKTLWKKGWELKANKRRFAVRTTVLRVYGRLGHELDKKQFEDVRRTWEWMIGNPHPSYGEALADICWYFGHMKDKRMALKFAWELDQPGTDSPNSPANPPREWWERRVKMWQGMHAAAVEALKRLTGQTFGTRAAAKKWFTDNEETFGVPWSDW